jgi:hypothetical protein
MSQSETRSATSANAAPVSTAGPWTLPYNPRKVEEDDPSDAIASFHIQSKAVCTNDFSWALQHSSQATGVGRGGKGNTRVTLGGRSWVGDHLQIKYSAARQMN